MYASISVALFKFIWSLCDNEQSSMMIDLNYHKYSDNDKVKVTC